MGPCTPAVSSPISGVDVCQNPKWQAEYVAKKTNCSMLNNFASAESVKNNHI